MLRKLIVFLMPIFLITPMPAAITETENEPAVIYFEDFSSDEFSDWVTIEQNGVYIGEPEHRFYIEDSLFTFGYNSGTGAYYTDYVVTFPVPRIITSMEMEITILDSVEEVVEWGQLEVYYDGIYQTGYQTDREIIDDYFVHEMRETVSQVVIRYYDMNGSTQCFMDDLVFWAIPYDILVEEFFEGGINSQYITTFSHGDFNWEPGVRTNDTYGFGLSSNRYNSLNDYTSGLNISFDDWTYVYKLYFVEKEVHDNWGSLGWVFVDGEFIRNFGRTGETHNELDEEPRVVDITVDAEVKSIDLIVNDITDLSEIQLELLVVTGTDPNKEGNQFPEDEIPAAEPDGETRVIDIIIENFEDGIGSGEIQPEHPYIYDYTPGWKYDEGIGSEVYYMGTAMGPDPAKSYLHFHLPEMIYIESVSFDLYEEGGEMMSRCDLVTPTKIMEVWDVSPEEMDTAVLPYYNYLEVKETLDYFQLVVYCETDRSEIIFDNIVVTAHVDPGSYYYPNDNGELPDEDIPEGVVPVQFTDFDETHWAYDFVMYMVNEGIIVGYPDGQFKPEAFFSRAAFSKLLTLSFDIPVDEAFEQRYLDVQPDDWSFNFVMGADPYLTHFILPDGTEIFKPGDMAVREDVAVAMVKAMGLDPDQADMAFLEQYADQNEVTESLRPYVALAIEYGVMQGWDGHFHPHQALTRAEACTLFARFLQNIKGTYDNAVKVTD